MPAGAVGDAEIGGLSNMNNDLREIAKGDIICRRTEHGPEVNIPHRFVKHSPAGLEWGYGGSGPADLALNALAAYIGRKRAEKDGLYQEFKWDFIARLPFEGGTIKRDDVMNWLKAKGVAVVHLL